MYCIDISNVLRNVITSSGINTRIVNVLYLSNGIYMYVQHIYNFHINIPIITFISKKQGHNHVINLQCFEDFAVFKIVKSLVLNGLKLVVRDIHRLEAGHVREFGEENELIGGDVQSL